jgi:hypothetical protein
MKFIIILIIIVSLVLLITACNNEDVVKTQCVKNSDCTTPDEFLIQSNCPFQSVCISGLCKVVCPLVFGGETDTSECSKDSDCDCRDRGNRSLECKCIDLKCFSVEG